MNQEAQYKTIKVKVLGRNPAMQGRNRRMERGLIPLITDIRHVHVEILAYTQGKTIHTYIS